jgi:hypothetical protein
VAEVTENHAPTLKAEALAGVCEILYSAALAVIGLLLATGLIRL